MVQRGEWSVFSSCFQSISSPSIHVNRTPNRKLFLSFYHQLVQTYMLHTIQYLNHPTLCMLFYTLNTQDSKQVPTTCIHLQKDLGFYIVAARQKPVVHMWCTLNPTVPLCHKPTPQAGGQSLPFRPRSRAWDGRRLQCQ